MLKGDLATTSLPAVLDQLAAEPATGCLHVIEPSGDEALVYFKAGLVYSASVPGRRPSLGARLISSGALSPEALAEALAAQREELQGWRLGELLVHLGFVEQPVVEAFVAEQLRDAMTDLMRWPAGRFRFRKNERTREDVSEPVTVAALVEDVSHRHSRWDEITQIVHGPTAVPVLSARGPASADIALDADAWALLCKIDNERTLSELARDCGFTLFEAGHVVATLVHAGLVDVDEDLPAESASTTTPALSLAVESDQPEPASGLASIVAAVASAMAGTPSDPDEPFAGTPSAQPSDDGPAGIAARLIEALGTDREPDAPLLPPDLPSVPTARPDATLLDHRGQPGQPEAAAEPDPDDPFGQSIARVSEALSALLGPQQDYDPFAMATRAPRKPDAQPERPALPPHEQARRDRLRAAAAAELAAAHAAAEAERRQAEGDEAPVATVVDLETVRREAEQRAAAERERAEAEAAAEAEAEAACRRADDELAAAEESGWQEYAERVAADRQAAEQPAWQEYAERVAADRRAAEQPAWQEHIEWLAAQRAAAETAAWDDHTAWVAAQRVATETAAWDDHAVWLAAERDRHAEAAWLENELREARLRAEEETARLAAEAEAEAEAARAAAEEEVRRLAAEEEARRCAEEAARAVALPPPPAELPPPPRQETPPPPYVPLAAPTAEAPPEPPPNAGFGASGDMTDTAMLLRELSSLGFDEDAEPAPARPAPIRPPAPAAPPHDRKRKGLFGR